MKMKKYQIVEIEENEHHAGSKATQDVGAVAEKMGYETIYLKAVTKKEGIIPKIQRQIGYFFGWNACYSAIEENSLVLLQHPFHHPQLTREKTLKKLKEKKHAKFICLVHDVEELRAYRYNNYYAKEFSFMLEIMDVIIVHNEKMKSFFCGRGVPEDKIVTLEIFDYLQDVEKELPKYEKSITVAGNLDSQKAEYISKLDQLNIKVHLYGPNCDEALKNSENIIYHGVFPADSLPEYLNSGFGLVWDGSSIDGCQGKAGQYIRYNNPHKLSLYLSSGLPVVIWEEAAEAGFVEDHKVGICIDSLSNLKTALEQLDEVEYNSMASNAADLAELLRKGHFAQTAIDAAQKRLGC